MTLEIPAEELAIGDQLLSYGTITSIVPNQDAQKNIVSYDISFFNGKTLNGVKPDDEFQATQGMTDHMPDASQIRPGLKDDHPNI